MRTDLGADFLIRWLRAVSAAEIAGFTAVLCLKTSFQTEVGACVTRVIAGPLQHATRWLPVLKMRTTAAWAWLPCLPCIPRKMQLPGWST